MPLNVVRYPKLCTRDAGADYLMHLPNWSPSPESNREASDFETDRSANSLQSSLVRLLSLELRSLAF